MTTATPSPGNTFALPMTAEDMLRLAISILQAELMARDSLLNPEKLWTGGRYMPGLGLEHAIALLLAVDDTALLETVKNARPLAAPFQPAARGHTAEEAQIGAIAAELGLFVRREADGYALVRTPEAGV